MATKTSLLALLFLLDGTAYTQDLAKDIARDLAATHTKTSISHPADRSPVAHYVWRSSIFALGSGAAADVLTSYRDAHIRGLYETHSLVTTNGKYNVPKAISIFALVDGGMILTEVFMHHRYAHRVDKSAAFVNLANTAAVGVVAVNNYRLGRR